MTVKIYAYKPGSASAKALAGKLNVKRIKHVGSRWKPRARDTVINWGCSNLPEKLLVCDVINAPEAVCKAANKLLAFEAMAMAGVLTPRFSTVAKDAMEWGYVKVVCRHKLTGHSGEGIEIVQENAAMPDAPLYVEYIKKKEEYRVHVAFGHIIDVQRKGRNRDVPDEDVNWQVRNHGNGFIYMRGGVALTDRCRALALAAVESLGLDFGAADIIWNERDDTYYVLEVNTAPGLSGTTLEKYADAFDPW
jgi:glutathione synthase/RimK-type ligase-like ATP-grasp enzyme